MRRPSEIERRLQDLDSKWNVGQWIETEAPSMIGVDMAPGIAHGRRWLTLSAIAASTIMSHGWYPLLPLFRRIGGRKMQVHGGDMHCAFSRE